MKQKKFKKIAKAIDNNQCTYAAKETCQNYLELFDCCTKPSVECTHRKSNSKHSKN